VEVEALVNASRGEGWEVKAGKVDETVTDLKAALPVVTLAPTLAEMEAERAGKTLSNVEAKALVNILADTLSEVVAKTFADTLTCVESEAPIKREVNSVAAVEA